MKHGSKQNFSRSLKRPQKSTMKNLTVSVSKYKNVESGFIITVLSLHRARVCFDVWISYQHGSRCRGNRPHSSYRRHRGNGSVRGSGPSWILCTVLQINIKYIYCKI